MSEPSQRHAFDLFADYLQFYIEDEAADVSPDEAGNAWTDEAVRILLAPARGPVRIQRAAASASVPGCRPGLRLEVPAAVSSPAATAPPDQGEQVIVQHH